MEKELTFWWKPSLLADFLLMFAGWLIPTNQEPLMLSLKLRVAGLRLTSPLLPTDNSATDMWSATTRYFFLK